MKKLLCGLMALACATLTIPAYAATPGCETKDSAGNCIPGSVLIDPATGLPYAAGGSAGGTTATVVSGDQAFTVGTSQPLTMTPTGRLRIGLSSAATVGATAATIADLIGAVDSNNNQQPLKVDASGNLKAADAANAAFSGSVALTPGTTYTGTNIGRSIAMVCTATGNVSVTFSDASVLVVPITATGLTILPFAISIVNTSGTTATCTYSNLK